MNRITTAIDKMRENACPKNTKALDLDFEEYFRFQELKSLAVAEDVLTPEEGQTIYTLLGNMPDCFNRQDYAVKATLTKVFLELMKAKRHD